MKRPQTFKQYALLLVHHDWFYSFSDCYHTVKLAGEREKQLTDWAKSHPALKAMFAHMDAWRSHCITEKQEPMPTLAELEKICMAYRKEVA